MVREFLDYGLDWMAGDARGEARNDDGRVGRKATIHG
jgi:hypothetical protein